MGKYADQENVKETPKPHLGLGMCNVTTLFTTTIYFSIYFNSERVLYIDNHMRSISALTKKKTIYSRRCDQSILTPHLPIRVAHGSISEPLLGPGRSDHDASITVVSFYIV